MKIHKFDLLISLYTFCIAVAELMGAKTFPITHIGTFKLNASVGIFVIPVIFTITDIITEVYGKERARSVVRSGFVVIFLIMLFAMLATHLPPSTRFVPSEKAYDDIFGKSVRIAAASLIAFAFSELLDVYLFSKIREKTGSKLLWLRTNVSNFISEFFDTALFITLAFYALNKPFGDNTIFLWSLIFPYWMLKNVMSAIETPFVYLGVRWLRSDTSSDGIQKS